MHRARLARVPRRTTPMVARDLVAFVIWVRGVEYGTAAELARRLNVTPWTIYKWRTRDQLATTRICGRDYSPITDAARIDLAKRDATRGCPRQLDTDTIAA